MISERRHLYKATSEGKKHVHCCCITMHAGTVLFSTLCFPAKINQNNDQLISEKKKTTTTGDDVTGSVGPSS
jgi:hypothetical protein